MPFSTVRALLVEDDLMTRSTVKVMLADMGITNIIEAGDGNRALQAIENNLYPIDIIVCDWNMPNKSGFEFLREIRQTHPTVPFLMITARADLSSVADARAAGVSGYIRKPFSYDQLNSKIVELLPEKRKSVI
jgi:two-component system, chemotaxis family, chemotaxis protein CheY